MPDQNREFQEAFFPTLAQQGQPNLNPALPRGPAYDAVSKPSHYNKEGGIESDGGPTQYYDFLPEWRTWNDLADFKAQRQWQEHSFHLGNIGKAIYRWGEKSGTSVVYDARKIVYSGLRVLLMLKGKTHVRDYLKSLLEDPQFKE